MAKKVSIYDVARYAHVSAASVSYVINGVDKVSNATRKKVLKGIQELRYTRSRSAVSLSTGHSRMLALILPWEDLSIAFTQNPFYGEFIGTFEKEIASSGYELIIEPSTIEKNIVSWSTSLGVDGFIVLGRMTEALYKGLSKVNAPTVLVDVYDEHAGEYANIRIDDVRGAYLATSHLLDLGHRAIAFVGGDIAHSIVDQKRYHGYEIAMKERGCTPVCHSFEATFLGGQKAAQAIAASPEITAVFCAADIMAIGMIRQYHLLGKRLPDDLSIVGFDNIQAAEYVSPSLTTIHQDIPEKARLSAEMILNGIRLGKMNVSKERLEPRLVCRESSVRLG